MCVRLQVAEKTRHLALFNLAIDSKLCVCDLTKLRVRDIAHGEHVSSRAIVMQQKTQHPVQFEITEQTRTVLEIGVDLAKNVFQIHGVDRHEQPVWRQRLSRERWLQTVLEKIEPGCEIGMESCSGAHHWARQLQARGFRVRLIAPQFVKPYVKSNKNDANDAEAICEAMSRPSMRFVAVKTIEQQDIQATHRIRAGLIEQRTAKANQIRGLIAEYGLVAPKELLMLRRAIPCWLEEADNGLTVRFRRLLDGL
ncbi:Transposase [compost metagenome]